LEKAGRKGIAFWHKRRASVAEDATVPTPDGGAGKKKGKGEKVKK